MKKSITFIKDRIVTGIVIIVPIAVIIVILANTIKKLITVTLPITSNMHIGGTLIRTIVVAVLIILILGVLFFISGVFFKTYFGRRFKDWLGEVLLKYIPFYNTINSVVHQLTGVEKGEFTAVEVDLNNNGSKLLGIHTDTLADGRQVIYVPFGPIINIGQVYIVPKEKVKVLNIPLKGFMDIISKIGFEANNVYKEN